MAYHYSRHIVNSGGVEKFRESMKREGCNQSIFTRDLPAHYASTEVRFRSRELIMKRQGLSQVASGERRDKAGRTAANKELMSRVRTLKKSEGLCP